MTWVDWFIKGASDKYIESEYRRRKLGKPNPCPPAIMYKKITGSELAELLPVKYMLDGKEYWTRRYIWDADYYLTTPDEIKRFLKWNMVNTYEYISDEYDCNRFAVSLMADAGEWSPGLCFGLMITTNHAKNIVLCSDMKVYEIEPQSDHMIGLRPETICSLYIF